MVYYYCMLIAIAFFNAFARLYMIGVYHYGLYLKNIEAVAAFYNEHHEN